MFCLRIINIQEEGGSMLEGDNKIGSLIILPMFFFDV